MSPLGDGGYSPYRDIGDATRCYCGHRYDEHTMDCCQHSQGEFQEDVCPCERFEPDEDAA